MLVAGWAGVFLNEYFRTRGNNLATKADFDSLQDQLRANTHLVETIKADVSQKDWAKREWTNIRRLQIEQLVTAMHDSGHYLERFRFHAMDGQRFEDRDPHSAIHAIGSLYLPELRKGIDDYLSCFDALYECILQFGLNLARAGIDQHKRQAVFDKFNSSYAVARDELGKAEQSVAVEAARLLRDIMGVAE
jgi:hypothetical protein